MILWMMPDNATHTQEVMDNFLADFKQENPDVTIDIRVINRRTLWAKIFTLRHEIEEETCPSLLAMPHYWTELLTEAGALVNLTELDKTLRVDNTLDPLRPHSYKKNTADVYSIPWWMDVAALHYREDHLKLVTDNPQELLSTWAGLLEACKKLKEYFSDVEGYFPLQNSDWRGTLSNRGVLPCLWSRGGYLLNKEGTRAGFSQPEFRQGLEDYIELALKGYMPILRERSSLGTISSGKSSLVITRRQGLSMFEEKKTSFAVKTLSVPRTGANYVNYLGGVSIGLINGGRDKQNALKLLKWITRPEKQVEYAALTEVFPALEASFESLLLSSPGRMQNYTNIIASAATLSNHMATGTIMEILAEVMSNCASAIVRHSYNEDFLKQELKRAQEEATTLLELYSG
jgi:multiple sugar transport system substrate-binding protein